MKAKDEEIIMLFNEINSVGHNETNQLHRLLFQCDIRFHLFSDFFHANYKRQQSILEICCLNLSPDPTLMLANMDKFGGPCLCY